jgi:hypothetical protein
MNVETHQNELFGKNMRERFRSNAYQIYYCPSVCVRRMLESLSQRKPGREQTKQERNVWRDVPDIGTP